MSRTICAFSSLSARKFLLVTKPGHEMFQFPPIQVAVEIKQMRLDAKLRSVRRERGPQTNVQHRRDAGLYPGSSGPHKPHSAAAANRSPRDWQWENPVASPGQRLPPPPPAQRTGRPSIWLAASKLPARMVSRMRVLLTICSSRETAARPCTVNASSSPSYLEQRHITAAPMAKNKIRPHTDTLDFSRGRTPSCE